MRALITGGAGFIGSHLAEELIHRGYKVEALDNLSTGRYENVAKLEGNPNFQLIVGSILNETLVDKLVERVDIVFHLAAAVGVELIVKKPLDSLTTNIKGSEIVLEMAYRYRKKVIITSTSEIYGKNTNGPLKEDEDRILGSPLKSRWSYSTSKAVDEILAYVYWKEKSVPTIIVRLFNTVGPRQTGAYGMVLPRFVSQALKDEFLTIYGTGKQSRCFLHVSDAVDAIINLSEHKNAVGEAFNVGSQEEITIENLAKKVIELINSKSNIIYIPYDKAYEEGFEDMERRVPDICKINAMIGFKPKFNLEGIIKSVIEYCRTQK
ncbi:MAG: NAD-dependent epimerase/dehydratase family protein [Candidatus Omnitrophica bacterium]|nr:NAD-dependent epimerase/dehydratase family protein [Candidatus Omnitrophota bacterium]